MAGENYYLLTALPALPDFGGAPPMALAALLAHLSDAPAPRAQAEAIFLSDDLLQRDGVLAGEGEQAAPAVLTSEQAAGEAPLPDFLAPGEEGPVPPEGRLRTEAVWAAYFRHAARLAGPRGFLAEWVRLEVGLRNALAAARAKALDLDVEAYFVAPELGAPIEDFDEAVAAWSAASDPLAALRALDGWRWARLAERDRWFTFADDELAAYAAKLLLLCRWKRIEVRS